MSPRPHAHDSQVLKGLVGLLVLGILQDGESYGYELTSRLREAGLSDLNEGTVYPVLTRLEKEKLLSTRLVASNSGPARKYYALTELGVASRRESFARWRELADIVDAIASERT